MSEAADPLARIVERHRDTGAEADGEQGALGARDLDLSDLHVNPVLIHRLMKTLSRCDTGLNSEPVLPNSVSTFPITRNPPGASA